ncbi:MAG: hypothetical protein JST83_01340 [Bacteroidetes bacterium]|nr:hypothetical protein [Bacteroidota bacterium]
MVVLHCPWLHVSGMALWPFVLIRDREGFTDASLLRHERIHFRQQLELLILPFYLLYVLNYAVNVLRYKNGEKAYREILFECEAYAMDTREDYLKQRRPYAWLRMFYMKH